MDFSVHMDDANAQRLRAAAKALGRTRNALIRQALEEWLQRQRRLWPEAVLTFKGIRGVKPFERHRQDLQPPASLYSPEVPACPAV